MTAFRITLLAVGDVAVGDVAVSNTVSIREAQEIGNYLSCENTDKKTVEKDAIDN